MYDNKYGTPISKLFPNILYKFMRVKPFALINMCPLFENIYIVQLVLLGYSYKKQQTNFIMI